MSIGSARKLRLHPAPDVPDIPIESGSGHGRWIKPVAGILIVGLGLALAAKVTCLFMRSYQADAPIAIHGPAPDNMPDALRRHLLAVQTLDLIIPSANEPGGRISVPDLLGRGRMSVYPSTDRTFSIRVTAPDADQARRLADDLAKTYVAYVTGTMNPGQSKITGHREKVLARYKRAQQDHERLRVQTAQLTGGMADGQIDRALGTLSQSIQSRTAKADQLIARLERTNAEIDRLRDRLAHPNLNVDPERWRQMKLSDRLYAGDLVVLKSKHREYLANIQTDMKGLTLSLADLSGVLTCLAGGIEKQLQVKLPEDVSDDLLEMNLAVEKYGGQITKFQQRWERYQAKLTELLTDPSAADFDGIATLLSQLRQDLSQRCARLPEHLQGLLTQIRQGSSASSGKPGKLSGLTARQVAGSSLTAELDLVQDAWRKTTYHLNRLFPDANVQLLTLGRVCRSLQWRLNFREKQLRQIFEKDLLAAYRRETRNKIVEQQKDFQSTGKSLTELYRSFGKDQAALARIAQRWPELQKSQDQIRALETQLASLEKELGSDVHLAGPERLELLPSTVRVSTMAGLSPKSEWLWSALLGLLAGLVAFVATIIPNAFGRFKSEAHHAA